MKLPEDTYYEGDLYAMWPRGSFLKVAREAAALLSLETGVLVKVTTVKELECPAGIKEEDKPIREIFFTVMNHQFNTLDEARRAIANKSFL